MAAAEGAGPRLTPEQEEQMCRRLYEESLARKKQQLEELDRRYYPVTAPKRLPASEIEAAVRKQEDFEARRRQRQREAREKTYPQPPTRTISSEEADECVTRLYTESIKKKSITLQQLETRYDWRNSTKSLRGEPKRISKAGLRDFVGRMAVPVDRNYSIEQINKIYGLS